MAKQTGLGHRLLVGGIDISGDVTVLDEITGSMEELECTGISKSARERLGGVRDGGRGCRQDGGLHDRAAGRPGAGEEEVPAG